MYEQNISTLKQFVKAQEVDKHFKLKCGSRGRNAAHCNAVVDLAVTAWNSDKNAFAAFCKEFGDYSTSQFMMAATGRPFKSRKSGKKDGTQATSDEIANQALSDLAAFVGVDRPDVKYNNCELGLTVEMKAPATVKKQHKKTA